MAKKTHYPPAYYRYQSEHPSITIHVNKTLKGILDRIKGNKSYAQVIIDILQEKIDLQRKVEFLPVSEAVISYYRGFAEGKEEYAAFDKCRKCNRINILDREGLCSKCDPKILPKFSRFRDMDIASFVDEDIIQRAGVKMPSVEQLSYRNGMKSGQSKGYEEGYEAARKEFEITYRCNSCGKPIAIKSGSREHNDAARFLTKSGWGHTNCP